VPSARRLRHQIWQPVAGRIVTGMTLDVDDGKR
jgi:hypothetical protein